MGERNGEMTWEILGISVGRWGGCLKSGAGAKRLKKDQCSRIRLSNPELASKDGSAAVVNRRISRVGCEMPQHWPTSLSKTYSHRVAYERRCSIE
jgi:hypothetical protein